MTHEEQTDKSRTELTKRAWKTAKDVRIAILITVEKNMAIARPMAAHADPDAHLLHFLTSADSRKTHHAGPGGAPATVFFNEGNTYVSFTGEMSISNDRAKIRELWSPLAKAWWDSADDPDIRVLTVRPVEGEIWDGPNKMAAVALMLTAAVTGSKPKVGDHAKLGG